jgi:hypothetical protein
MRKTSKGRRRSQHFLLTAFAVVIFFGIAYVDINVHGHHYITLRGSNVRRITPRKTTLSVPAPS